MSNDAPNVRKFLDLSTAHVSKDTRLFLEDQADRQSDGTADLHVANHQYGWWVYVQEDRGENVPDDLWAVMQRAHENGCDYILFDRDGEALDGLPVYEWR